MYSTAFGGGSPPPHSPDGGGAAHPSSLTQVQAVEIYYGYVEGDHRAWDTVTVTIPPDTPGHLVESVALDLFWSLMDEQWPLRAVVFTGVYAYVPLSA
jgi:hypothetical protein